MSKEIIHRGMKLTEEEHGRWHKEHGDLTVEEHAAMMKKMGITDEADRQWHSAP